MTELALALAAGLVSTLSPCVLPLLPLIVGAAIGQHRFGPAALAAGLALSFTGIGLFVATIGFAIGLNDAVFRSAAAALLLAAGVVLILPAWQARLAAAAGPAGNWMQVRFGGMSGAGLSGQFAIGLLLGAVWSPCVGPTLGAATLLAAKGENLGAVALTMLSFGVGAALPLLAIGLVSRDALMRVRDRLLAAGQGGKAIIGVALILIGGLVLSGYDKILEARLVELSPDWLTALTTRF